MLWIKSCSLSALQEKQPLPIRSSLPKTRNSKGTTKHCAHTALKMSAWGKNGSARSCDALLKRVEQNDPRLSELIILPLKRFGSNELFRLSKALESGINTNLKSLQASGHAIDDVRALEALGRGLSKIESIAIGDSETSDAGVCAFCQGMESNPKRNDGSIALKSVDLSYKNIGKDGLRAVLKVFANLPSLEYLDLSRNEQFGPSFQFWEETSSLSLSTPILANLTHLDLSSCGLDAKSCSTLLKAMDGNENDNNARDLVLKLNSNDLSDREGLKEMMSILSKGTLVTELFLSRCQIGDEGLEIMVDECCSGQNTSNNGSLQRLDLSHNNLSSVSPLAKQLHPRPDNTSSSNPYHYFSGLEKLDLTGNPLGSNLLSSIESNPEWILSLQELDLSHTSCDVYGAMELIRSCNTKKSSLKKLNLFGNGLGSNGFLALSDILHGGHLSLEYLDLGGNGAEESAVVVLVMALGKFLEDDSDQEIVPKGESTLQVLVVGANKGGPALEKAIKDVQKVHPSLDIARDKVKKKNEGMPGGNMFNSTPGTSWMA